MIPYIFPKHESIFLKSNQCFKQSLDQSTSTFTLIVHLYLCLFEWDPVASIGIVSPIKACEYVHLATCEDLVILTLQWFLNA